MNDHIHKLRDILQVPEIMGKTLSIEEFVDMWSLVEAKFELHKKYHDYFNKSLTIHDSSAYVECTRRFNDIVPRSYDIMLWGKFIGGVNNNIYKLDLIRKWINNFPNHAFTIVNGSGDVIGIRSYTNVSLMVTSGNPSVSFDSHTIKLTDGEYVNTTTNSHTFSLFYHKTVHELKQSLHNVSHGNGKAIPKKVADLYIAMSGF